MDHSYTQDSRVWELQRDFRPAEPDWERGETANRRQRGRKHRFGFRHWDSRDFSGRVETSLSLALSDFQKEINGFNELLLNNYYSSHYLTKAKIWAKSIFGQANLKTSSHVHSYVNLRC